jgi:hypothetical protein
LKGDKEMKRNMFFKYSIVITLIITQNLIASVSYYSEEDFINAFPFTLSMESFEGLPVDNQPYIHSSLSLSDFTVSTDGDLLGVYDLGRFAGMHSTHGDQYVAAAGDIETTYQLDIYLDSPVKAFGLYITDWGDVGSGTLSLDNYIESEFTIASGSQPGDNDIFFGIISDTTFDHISINQNNTGDGFSIDEVYYGIPEPSTLLLLGLGTIILRRRKH